MHQPCFTFDGVCRFSRISETLLISMQPKLFLACASLATAVTPYQKMTVDQAAKRLLSLQYLNPLDAFVFNVDCYGISDTLCASAKEALIETSKMIAGQLLLTQQIKVSVSFVYGSKLLNLNQAYPKSIISQELTKLSMLNVRTIPTFVAATKDNGTELMYPQSVVKQSNIGFQPSEYDMRIVFNAETNWSFEKVTKINSFDFASILIV